MGDLGKLKTQGQDGVIWSDGFNGLYYESGKLGLAIFMMLQPRQASKKIPQVESFLL